MNLDRFMRNLAESPREHVVHRLCERRHGFTSFTISRNSVMAQADFLSQISYDGEHQLPVLALGIEGARVLAGRVAVLWCEPFVGFVKPAGQPLAVRRPAMARAMVRIARRVEAAMRAAAHDWFPCE